MWNFQILFCHFCSQNPNILCKQIQVLQDFVLPTGGLPSPDALGYNPPIKNSWRHHLSFGIVHAKHLGYTCNCVCPLTRVQYFSSRVWCWLEMSWGVFSNSTASRSQLFIPIPAPRRSHVLFPFPFQSHWLFPLPPAGLVSHRIRCSFSWTSWNQ